MRAEVYLCGVLAVTLLAAGCEKRSRSTALHEAAEYGRLDEVQELIVRRARINARDADERTPLHEAARNGHAEVVQVLARCGARIDATDEDGQTPAMLAMQKNHRAVVEYLVQAGAGVTLPLAVYLGDAERVKALIAAGADLNVRTGDGWASLHIAAWCNQRTIAELLVAAGADVNAGVVAEKYEHRSKRTPLHYAALYGRPEIAQLLIQAGASVGARDGYNDTPLHWAAQNGHVEVVHLLLASGAEVNARDDEERSPLYLAAEEGQARVVEALMSAGADADRPGKYRAPLHAAIAGPHVDVVRLLAPRVKDINAGLPLHTVVSCDWTWLNDEVLDIDPAVGDPERDDAYLARRGEAVRRIRQEILRILLDNGADVNRTTDFGWTALCEAASHGLTDVVEMFLDAGAGIGLVAESIRTPLYAAAAMGERETAQLLLARGAEVNERQSGEDAPLHAALRGYYSPSRYSGEMYDRDYRHELREYLGVADTQEDPSSYEAEEQRHIKQEWQRITGIIRLLLDYGADVNAVGRCGDMPLHVAVRVGHRAAAELLIAGGADVNARNSGIQEEWRKEAAGQTPLLLALRKDRIDIADLLIDHGAAMDVRDEAGQTALSLAIQRACDYISPNATDMEIDPYLRNRTEEAMRTPLRDAYHSFVERLLSHGVDTNVKDQDGSTALHHTARAGSERLTDLLLAKGADANATDTLGQTPLHYAAREDADVVRILLENGASANLTDNDGDTPLHEAALRGRAEIVQLLLAHGADPGVKNRRGETPRDIAIRRRHHEVTRLLTAKAGETIVDTALSGADRQ